MSCFCRNQPDDMLNEGADPHDQVGCGASTNIVRQNAHREIMIHDRCASFAVYCALTNNMPLAIIGWPIILIGIWRLNSPGEIK
jgi:hypothetical protein